jgi:hypothetical protein
MPEKLYRPYFNASQLRLLYSLLDQSIPSHHTIEKILRKYLVNIEADLLTPSYQTKEKQSIESKLGFTSEEEASLLAGNLSEDEEAALLAKLMNGV